jgi:photosystem II stability/assembly factor-like uncharacterized protein
MSYLAASLATLALLLIGACSPVTPAPTPTTSASASLAPVASTPAAASASPSAAPAFEPFPPIQYLDNTTLFAGSFPQVFRSDDTGASWVSLGAPLYARFEDLRMIDRDRGWSVLFFIGDQPQIGCQQASTAAPCHSAIAVTSDGGRSWTVRLTSPLNPGGGASIDHLQAVDAAHAWALVTTTCDQSGVCDKELRATADGGSTWKTLRSGRLRQLRVASLGRAWLGEDAGNGSVVYSTADGGTTWRQQLATQQPLIALDAASERDAWALTEDGGYCTASSCQRYELLVTADGGGSWSSLANPKENVVSGPACTFGHLAGPIFASPRIGWLGVNRGAGGAAVGPGGMMRTEDGGRTWTCSLVPPDVGRLSAADPDHVLALSRDAQSAAYAIWLSIDSGRSWSPVRIH